VINKPFSELWDIVRETEYAKGRWYYPFLWLLAVLSVVLFGLMSILLLPVFIIILIICYLMEKFGKEGKIHQKKFSKDILCKGIFV